MAKATIADNLVIETRNSSPIFQPNPHNAIGAGADAGVITITTGAAGAGAGVITITTGAAGAGAVTITGDGTLNFDTLNFGIPISKADIESSMVASASHGGAVTITGDGTLNFDTLNFGIPISKADIESSMVASASHGTDTPNFGAAANPVAPEASNTDINVNIINGGSITYKDHVYNEGTYRVVGDNLLAADPAEISVDSLGALVP